MVFENNYFYEEVNMFDEKIDELRESLMKSIKLEHVKELEMYKKENEELQYVKENYNKIKSEYEEKKREIEFEKSKIKAEVRKERLDELMGGYKVILYRADYERHKLPKCDKCNEDRKIPYKTPLGKQEFEKCDCTKSKRVYRPTESLLYEFRMDSWGKEMIVFYKYDEQYDSMSTVPKYIYDETMNFDELIPYSTFFRNPEDCQKYCDYLTGKERHA